MNERACETCRYGEDVMGFIEEIEQVVAVKCMWGPPGIGFDLIKKQFTKVALNMHPKEWCYRWKPKITPIGMNTDVDEP